MLFCEHYTVGSEVLTNLNILKARSPIYTAGWARLSSLLDFTLFLFLSFLFQFVTYREVVKLTKFAHFSKTTKHERLVKAFFYSLTTDFWFSKQSNEWIGKEHARSTRTLGKISSKLWFSARLDHCNSKKVFGDFDWLISISCSERTYGTKQGKVTRTLTRADQKQDSGRKMWLEWWAGGVSRTFRG